MVGKAVARYIRDNDIAQRVSGKHKWTVEVRYFLALSEDLYDYVLGILMGQVGCSKDEECIVGASVGCSGKLAVVQSEIHVLLLLLRMYTYLSLLS